MGPSAMGWVGLNVFFAVTLMALSCTILAVNRQQLYYGTTYCYSYWWYYPYSCRTFITGCLISGDYQWHVPCKYAIAVGSVGIFFAVCACCYQCSSKAPMGNAIMGVIHTVWWVTAAALFTEWKQDISNPDYPQEHWRTVLEALTWTNAAISIVMLLMSIVQFKVWKTVYGDDDDFDAPQEKKEHKHHHKDGEAEAGGAPGPDAPPPAPAQAY